jgi:hypothetical protein
MALGGEPGYFLEKVSKQAAGANELFTTRCSNQLLGRPPLITGQSGEKRRRQRIGSR